MRAKISPRLTCRSTSASAVTPPNSMVPFSGGSSAVSATDVELLDAKVGRGPSADGAEPAGRLGLGHLLGSPAAGDDALGSEDHHDDEGGTEHQLPVFGEAAEPL